MPAHSESDTGTRFGIGARSPRPARPHRGASRSRRRAAQHRVVPQRHGLRRPVVPDVNWMIASLGRRARGRGGRHDRAEPRRRAGRRRARRATPVGSSIAPLASRPRGTRGFSGTNAPPALHTANHAAIAAGSVRREHADRPPGRGRAPRKSRRKRRRALQLAPASSRCRRAYATTSSAVAVEQIARAIALTGRSRTAAAGPRPRAGGRCASG